MRIYKEFLFILAVFCGGESVALSCEQKFLRLGIFIGSSPTYYGCAKLGVELKAMQVICDFQGIRSVMAATVRRIISSPKLYNSGLPYSAGVLVDKTLYIAGQIGWNVNGQLANGVEAQTRLALENMGHVLAAAGANHSNVVKVTVLLADLNDGPKVNAVYSTFFKENRPARAAYQVAKLPAGALVEIEAIAIVGEIIDSKL